MRNKVSINSNKEKVKKEVVSKKKNQTTQSKEKTKKNIVKEKQVISKEEGFKKYLTKTNITYFILLILDIFVVIYSARQNIVNYIIVLDEEIFVSKVRYLLWGRNYINIFIIAFFYIYTCIVNRYFLQRKNTKKFLFWLFIVLVVLNVLLFALFTRKVY